MQAFHFGTKAETLDRLTSAKLSCRIPPLYYFTVGNWTDLSEEILDNINSKYSPTSIVARSSSLVEDGKESSMAGAFISRLSIDSTDRAVIQTAVEDVIASYPYRNNRDQVLIQPMLDDVVVSGVIMTRCLDDGAPYYVLNYDDESGKTDSVTGGTGAHKTVYVYRNFKEEYFDSSRVRRMLYLAKELETICGDVPLDIEFGIDKSDQLHLFQVRRITTTGQWSQEIDKHISHTIPIITVDLNHRLLPRNKVYGRRTIFTNMSDWNPAELIGVVPRPLSRSLFHKVITQDIWRLARSMMGYRTLPEEDLMVNIGGHVYIDVRNSFNSFLPAGLDFTIGEKLVDAWIDRLDAHPELHDKVEFEIVQSIYDFSFQKNFDTWYSGLLNPSELETFRSRLHHLTAGCLDQSETGSLHNALENIRTLSDRQAKRVETTFEDRSPYDILVAVKTLVEECRQYGTLAFSIIARHGFIAESLLRSAGERGALSADRIQMFKRSIHTVMGDLTADLAAVYEERMPLDQFLSKYGHLRPSTYDICSLRYVDRGDLFDEIFVDRTDKKEAFSLTDDESEAINALLKEAGLHMIDAHQLIRYADRAIVGREYAKFVFTKNISEALEGIWHWGDYYQLDRDDVSYLAYTDIFETLPNTHAVPPNRYFTELIQQRRHHVELANTLRMSYVVRDIRDLYVVPVHRAAPNFITTRKSEGYVSYLNAVTPSHTHLYRKIVCIESADPGFDWIFAKGIQGLITKYGGANSHMAIRCAELGLPAAIGCGEMLFDKVVISSRVELDCAEKRIRFIHG